ncbi:MAG: hypothetical protein CMB66_04310 [Euryarchaeota archaeon]|nr:hypothetical protein [Euryarchaeota archaeon]
MRFAISLTLITLLILALTPLANSHEPKEYTILLTEEGTTPGSIPAGVLVEGDSLFFMNVDDREGISHRVQIDSDGDGGFGGPDDFSTEWLTGSCELNENGSKVEEACLVAVAVLLGPENGLLPGLVAMKHQVRNGSEISESDLSANFGPDVHTEPVPQNSEPKTPSPIRSGGSEDLLVVILFCSLMGIMAILPSLIQTDG